MKNKFKAFALALVGLFAVVSSATLLVACGKNKNSHQHLYTFSATAVNGKYYYVCDDDATHTVEAGSQKYPLLVAGEESTTAITLQQALAYGGHAKLTQDVTISDVDTLNTAFTAETSIIDLANNELVVNKQTDEESWVIGKEVTVDQETTYTIQDITFKNGSLTFNTTTSTKTSIWVLKGSSVTLDGVNFSSTGTALYPNGNAAKVNVLNSTLNVNGAYGVATNAGSDDNYGVIITVRNSTINMTAEDKDSTALLINVAGTLDVENTTINAQRQGVIVRAGTATILNSTIVSQAINNNAFISRNDNPDDWGSGNEVAMAAIVVGSSGSKYINAYKADAVLTISGSTINVTTEVESLIENNDLVAIYLIKDDDRSYKTEITMTETEIAQDRCIEIYKNSVTINYGNTTTAEE